MSNGIATYEVSETCGIFVFLYEDVLLLVKHNNSDYISLRNKVFNGGG